MQFPPPLLADWYGNITTSHQTEMDVRLEGGEMERNDLGGKKHHLDKIGNSCESFHFGSVVMMQQGFKTF